MRRKALSLSLGPWPDVGTVRLFLGQMARRQAARWPAALAEAAVPHLAAWLVRQELGPLACHHFQQAPGPGGRLAEQLQPDSHRAAAEAALRQRLLAEILDQLRPAAIPVVLLKGMALQQLYGRAGTRTMSDLDFWLPADRMDEAVRLLQTAGYQPGRRAERPLALQRLSDGEIQLTKKGWRAGLIELHWSPFAGWWLQRTAAVDSAAVWRRVEPLALPHDAGGSLSQQPAPVGQLAAEDMLIQLAVHLAVNHQFAPPVARGLMDMVLTARARPVDWPVVVARARQWRVATAVWLALYLADQLIGLEEAAAAIQQLQPNRRRRWLLRHFVSPESVLAGRDWCHDRRRYLLLLSLVDRPRAALKLLWRACWPEDAWLQARYGAGASRPRHLWQLLRYGQF